MPVPQDVAELLDFVPHDVSDEIAGSDRCRPHP
jgi:hypothetical protein